MIEIEILNFIVYLVVSFLLGCSFMILLELRRRLKELSKEMNRLAENMNRVFGESQDEN